MTDYTRPNSQWGDSPDSASDLNAWHLEYFVDGEVVTTSLVEGARPRLGAGLIVASDDGTTITLSLAEEVNGEMEVEVVSIDGLVQITI